LNARGYTEALLRDAIRWNYLKEARVIQQDFSSAQNQKILGEAEKCAHAAARDDVDTGTIAYHNIYADPSSPLQQYGSTASEGTGYLSWTGVRKDARLPNADASMPYQDAGGVYRAHCEGNLDAIPGPVNMAKFTQLPGVIAEIAEYMNLPEPQTQEQKDYSFERLKELAGIRMKTPYKKLARMSKDFDPDRLRYDLNEWISGSAAVDGEGPWTTAVSRYTPDKAAIHPNLGWGDDEEQATLDRIIREIEQHFDVELRRLEGGDGAPFIGEGEIPSDWSWRSWKVISVQRLGRMKKRCNRWWKSKFLTPPDWQIND